MKATKQLVKIGTAAFMFLTLFLTVNFNVKAENVEYVASIDGKGFPTLQEAFNAVSSQGKEVTIQLISSFEMETNDIATLEMGKNVILDLNSKSITVKNDFVGRPIVNKGTLRVLGNGSINSSMSSEGYGAINNYGNLTIDNGNFTGHKLGDGACIRNTEGKLIINGGVFGGSTSALYNDEKATAIINDGIFKSTSCSQCHTSIWSYCINSRGNITINKATVYGVQGGLGISGGIGVVNDGHFETVACENHGASAAFYGLYVAGERGETFATINGGKFISASREAALIGNDYDGGEKLPAKCTINNGYFLTNGPAEIPVINSHALTGDPTIVGGIYCKELKPSFIKDGYKQVKNNDGSYKVVPKIENIILSQTIINVEKGKETQLIASITPMEASEEITWESSNPLVAAVDAIGKVTGVSVGKAKITARADDKEATCEVQVYEIEKPVLPPPPVNDGKDTTIEVNEKTSEVLSNSLGDVVSNIATTTAVDNDTKEKLMKAIEDGEQITIAPVTEKLETTSVKVQEVIEKVEQVISEKATIAQYFDLSMMIKASGSELGKLNELSETASFTITVPTDLTKEGRAFYMVRIHEGVAEKIAGTLKGNEFTFESDKFSVYALVYEDTKAEEPGNEGEAEDSEDTVDPDNKEETIDKEETEDKKDTTVDTGDSTNKDVLYNLMSLSILAIGVLVVKKKFSI